MPGTERNSQPACRRPRRVALAAGTVSLVCLLAGGCAVLDRLSDQETTPTHSLSLHRFAEPGQVPGNATRVITDAAGSQQVCIRRLPLISNRQITAGRLEETGNPERPAIRLLLDHQGAVLWMQACHEAPGDVLAVVLDGFYWFALRIPRPLDTQSIRVDGSIGRSEAEAIVKSLPKLYRKQNPSLKLF